MSLTQREKKFVIGGVVFLGLIIALQIFVQPTLHRIGTLRRLVTQEQETLDDLRAKSKEYNALRSQLEQMRLAINRQQKGRQMLSLFERLQKDCRMTRKVIYITPTTTAISDVYEKTNVEVKFGAVTLDQIIQFLLKIESSQLVVGVRSLEVKCGAQNPALLDAVIQVADLSTVKSD